MKTVEYSRYRTELFSTGKVKFDKAVDTVDFVSILVMEYYRKYLEEELSASADFITRNDFSIRLGCEPGLVQNYVEYFLKEKLPNSTCFWYKFLNLLTKEPVLKVDVVKNKNLYEYVLERLHRTNDVPISRIFPVDMVLLIEGDHTVRIEAVI